MIAYQGFKEEKNCRGRNLAKVEVAGSSPVFRSREPELLEAPDGRFSAVRGFFCGLETLKVKVEGDVFDGVPEAPMYGIEMPFKSARTSTPRPRWLRPRRSGTSEAPSANSKLRALFASERAEAVLEDHLPGIMTHPEIDQAMDLTLPQIARYAPDALPQSVLDAIGEDLAKR